MGSESSGGQRQRNDPNRLLKEDLLASLLETSNDIVWCTSADGKQLLYLNPAAERIYGRPLAELTKDTNAWFDAIHPDDRDAVRKNQSDLFNRGQIEQEYRIVRPDGELLWLQDRVSVIRDNDGKPIYVGGIATDITAIRESDVLYHSLVESLPLNVVRKDIAGKIAFGNQRYCETVGAPLKDLIGKDDFDLFPAELARKYTDDDRRVLETGQVLNDIEQHQTSDGKNLYVEIFKGPIRDSQGATIGIQVMFWDVTLRHAAEKELRAAKEAADRAKESADAANRAKSEFVANMSHEIRTPMNGIIGMSELLKDTELSVEQCEYLGMIQQSAGALLGLLNDILDFSKIEAGKLELEAIPFNLSDSVGKTTRTLASRAAEKGLELACRISPELPERIIGDPGRLRQIIVNLVGNAIKFTERGEVVVEVESQTQSQSGGNVVLHFSVRDTGIGIPKKKQQQIFEAFSQADASTTRRFGGTGLGLAISSQLVQMMDGSIWIESEVGRGTTFHFTAEFKIAEEQPLTDRFQLPSLAGLPTLVVDDNTTNQRILEEMLKSWTLAPTVADGGVGALTEMQRAANDGHPYRLVVLDCMMPGMDGFSLAELISGNAALDNPAMIMLSSATRPGDVDRCRKLGIVRHMTKPVIKSELFDSIVDALGEPRAESDASVADIPTRDIPTRAGPTLNILLVEDGVINQRVATGFLERAGHKVSLANDGKQAVDASEQEDFDLVLMDVQMPVMDGLEATMAIRERESTVGGHLKIIAMTAAAMKGDRERCMKAGMDAYISKPINADELFKTIAEQTEATISSAMASEPQDEVSVDKPIVVDFVAARKNVPGGDDEVLRDLAKIFLGECHKLMNDLEQGLAATDATAVRRAAHTLKGSARVICAEQLSTIASRIEELASDQELGGVTDCLPSLQSAASKTNGAIHDWLG